MQHSRGPTPRTVSVSFVALALDLPEDFFADKVGPDKCLLFGFITYCTVLT